jgi:dTDP-4-amino-4,6-dideoxygalactose transaminase
MKIPFMNLYEGLEPIHREIMDKIENLIINTQFIGGEEVSEFEREFAHVCGVVYVVGCAKGTDALILALKLLNIGQGHTVLVPANSFIASSESVTFVGAEVNFIDVKDKNWTLDPQKLEEYLINNKEKNIRAVIPVHLYGQMADMESIANIAKK